MPSSALDARAKLTGGASPIFRSSDATTRIHSVLVAVIDVGSNTVRLLVANVGRGEAPAPVATDKAYLGLGAEIARSGSLSPETVEAAAQVCGRFAERARSAGAEHALVIVTAPGRQGPRSRRARVRIARADAPPGARAHRRGRGVACVRGRALPRRRPVPDSVGVVDVGGGSTEVVVGSRATGALWVDSVDLGSLRLTRLALEGDPPSKRELRRGARPRPAGIRAALSSASRRGARRRRQRHALAKLVGRTFDADDAEAAIEMLARRRSSKVARGAGIDERRAGTVLAGALLLAETSRLLGRPFALARGGLREGVALALAREDGRAAAAA